MDSSSKNERVIEKATQNSNGYIFYTLWSHIHSGLSLEYHYTIIFIYLFLFYICKTDKWETTEREREKEIEAKKYDRQMNQKASETFKVQLNQLLRRVLVYSQSHIWLLENSSYFKLYVCMYIKHKIIKK